MAVIIQNLNKSFGEHHVLSDVNLTIEDGKLHALLGANGSGKSTLVKIITGVYQRDSGSIQVGDTALPRVVSPAQVKHFGVKVVHQEAPLVQSLTVLENVAMFSGAWGKSLQRIRWKHLNEKIRAIFESLNIPVNPKAMAGSLSAAERAMVSLAISLQDDGAGTELLILDEADASIPEDDAVVFLNIVRNIVASGVPVLMVTHRLRAVRQFSDQATVLCNSRVALSGHTHEMSDAIIVDHMLSEGQQTGAAQTGVPSMDLDQLWPAVDSSENSSSPRNSKVLQVRQLSGVTLNEVSFELQAGEIVGVAGLITSGIAEIPSLLIGSQKRTNGEILVDGQSLPVRFSPGAALQHGLAMLPSDRLLEGGVANLSLEENLFLPQLNRFWYKKKLRDATVKSGVQLFDIRPSGAKTRFATMSGGNQQKVLMAKWLLMRPKVLILNDPTNGVDPGARMKIFAAIQAASVKGIAVLFLSTEPEQLASLCTRVLILREGRIYTELSSNDHSISRENIARWCYS